MRTIHIKILQMTTVLFLGIGLNACASWLPDAHHIEIQQGNIITQAERDALKTGMTKNQVEALMGRAILRDPYHPERWDYIYTLKTDDAAKPASRLTLHFANDLLTTIDDTNFHPENSTTKD